MSDKQEIYAPRALRQVWEWKEAIHQEVKHLPLRDALDAIMDMGARAAAEYGFLPGIADVAPKSRVAEHSADYETKKGQ